VIGLAVTLGLWLFTGYTFTRRMEDVERQAADVAARYTRAQELLSIVRTQVLLSSVRVRDALLNPDRSAVDTYRHQVDSIYQTINDALNQYVPVLASDAEKDQIARLRREVDQFHQTTLAVLADSSGPRPTSARDLLNRHIVPRREAALGISEEIQSLNRAAFIRQQGDLAEIHRIAEQQSWQRLGLALAISLGIVLLAAFYAGRLEGRLRRQMERETNISSELQDVASRLMSAQEDERRTIARELHDEVGQVLTAIKVELAIAQRAIEAKGESGDALAEAQTITDGALQTVRDLSQLLRPSMLDDLGLPAAIDASLRKLARRHDIHAELQQVGMADDRLDPDTEVAAYRIVQEALTNIGRHAGASHCWVRLKRYVTGLTIEIEDDGIGFDLAVAHGRLQHGLGLIGMRERATHLGGTFDVQTAPGRGTRMIIDLPAAATGG
ncbi:MAG: ATP-binding protein, partial [Vicinamibacterales bacterium]